MKKFEAENEAVLLGLQNCDEHFETVFHKGEALVFKYSNIGVGKQFTLQFDQNVVLVDIIRSNVSAGNVNDVGDSEVAENSDENSKVDRDCYKGEGLVEDILNDDEFEEDIAVTELSQGKLT